MLAPTVLDANLLSTLFVRIADSSIGEDFSVSKEQFNLVCDSGETRWNRS